MGSTEEPVEPNEEYIEMANSPLMADELGSVIMAIVDRKFLVDVTVKMKRRDELHGPSGALYLTVKQMIIERRLMPLFIERSTDPIVAEEFETNLVENAIEGIEDEDVITPILFLLKEFAIYVMGKQHELCKQMRIDEKNRGTSRP